MKGVTPIVVSVLLLGVTVSLASFYAGWAPSLSGNITEKAVEGSEQNTRCRNAGLSIQNPEFDSNTGATVFELKNTGSIRLSQPIEVAAFSSAQKLNSTTIYGIEPGRTKPGSMETGSAPDRLLVNSVDCPELDVAAGSVEVTE